MFEYTINRFLCCDERLPFKFNYCPNCGAVIPKREDSQSDIENRKALATQKGRKTRLISLCEEICEFGAMSESEKRDYNKTCRNWSWEKQIEAMKREWHTINSKYHQNAPRR